MIFFRGLCIYNNISDVPHDTPCGVFSTKNITNVNKTNQRIFVPLHNLNIESLFDYFMLNHEPRPVVICLGYIENDKQIHFNPPLDIDQLGKFLIAIKETKNTTTSH
jgi:hypothetical protein